MIKKFFGKKDYVSFIVIGIFITFWIFSCFEEDVFDIFDTFTSSNDIRVLSSYENRDLEDMIVKYAKKENIDLSFTYMACNVSIFFGV